jgi:hypothetical protein
MPSSGIRYDKGLVKVPEEHASLLPPPSVKKVQSALLGISPGRVMQPASAASLEPTMEYWE